MPRVLVVDDDPAFHRLVELAIGPRGYQVIAASDGPEGMNKIRSDNPDIVILDKMMPGMDGFEVTRRIRREPKLTHIPILVVSSASQLDDKLEAFNAGADDYLTKPFEVDELAARLAALLRRAEAFKAARAQEKQPVDLANIIAVHSLRGGIGNTTVAVNLAIAMAYLWESPTLVADLVMSSGQVALMLNESIRRTWSDLSPFGDDEFDIELVESVVGQHSSGLYYLPAPKNPIDAEEVSNRIVQKALALLKPRYEYIIADLPHDFSDISLDVLEAADSILLLLAPDIISVRAATVTLNTYTKLDYDKDKIQLVLNRTTTQSNLTAKQIESALHHPISVVLPYSPKRIVQSINSGIPFVYDEEQDNLSALIENLAFRLSKESDQSIPPPAPSATWNRVNNRLRLFDTKKDGALRRGLGRIFRRN